MCYNITYKSPPEVRWARLELADRLHGSAFQKHRVCHFTTSALSLLLKYILPHIYCIIKTISVYLLMLTKYNYYSIVASSKSVYGEEYASMSVLL